MHSGHYNALRQAKNHADILVAGVVSDEEVLKNKGPPILKLEERIELARACKWVDEVAEGVPYDPSEELLDKLNCDYCAHGDDLPINAEGKVSGGPLRDSGRMKIIKRTEGISTTDIVGRLLLR